MTGHDRDRGTDTVPVTVAAGEAEHTGVTAAVIAVANDNGIAGVVVEASPG
jgi:hypothetical protein